MLVKGESYDQQVADGRGAGGALTKPGPARTHPALPVPYKDQTGLTSDDM